MDHTYISVCVHISRKLKVLKTSNGLRPPNSRKWAWTPGHRDAKGDLWHSWSFQNHSLTTHIWVFTYSQINTKCSISWAKSRILGPSCKPAWFISTITEPLTVPPRGRGGCGGEDARHIAPRARASGKGWSARMRLPGVAVRLRLPSWLGSWLSFWPGKLFNFFEPQSPPHRAIAMLKAKMRSGYDDAYEALSTVPAT